MIYILAGLALWTVSHAFKRMFTQMAEVMGQSRKGIVSLGSIIAIVLMVIGYRSVNSEPFWQPAGWVIAINNVLMLISLYFFAASGAKTRLSLVVRHPMLNGMMIWAVAHIIVNGDIESFLLFGGLFFWAMVTKRVIDNNDPWMIPNPAPIGKEIGVAVTTLVVYIGLLHAHGLLGPWPLWSGWPVDGPLSVIFTPF